MEDHKYLRALARERRTVFQYGTQTRSGTRQVGRMVELVRHGYIGEIREIHVTTLDGIQGEIIASEPVPDEFDYDLWPGPAPWKPYCRDRFTAWKGPLLIYDYSLGVIAVMGDHLLDIAYWAPHLPVEWEGTGVIPTSGLYDTVINGNVRATHASGVKRTMKAAADFRDNWTTIVGTEGSVTIGYEGIKSVTPESLWSVELKPHEERVVHPESNHMENFINCVRNRRTPVSDLESAVQSDFMSHLGNIAIRTGRKIKWDPIKETIVDDEPARRMIHRTAREPYGVYAV